MYGENSGDLRAELATLLRQHRVQQRIGGPGIHTVAESTTLQQRQALGEQIRRYRHMVLLWCHQAIRAAAPSVNPDTTPERWSRRPTEELRNQLTRAIETSTAGLPSMNELVTTQEFAMVESWRRAARAATLGEHDFDAGLDYGRLSDAQCVTVITDAAEITRGLVVLDRRYRLIPDWKPLRERGPLGLAAEHCTSLSGSEVDYTVDLRGWRPTPRPIDGPAMQGLPGVLQAEHNLLIQLTSFPVAHNLRLVLDAQRILSHEASLTARDVAPALADKWRTRVDTFTSLVQDTRDVGGQVGGGGLAAAEAANAVSRLRKLTGQPVDDPKLLHHLDRLFTQIDVRLSDIIEQGVSERLYFARVRLPRVTDQSAGLIKPIRARYVPLSSPLRTDVLKNVRTRLRPPPTRPRSPSRASRSRADFAAAIAHRPDQHGLGPTLSI